MKSKLRITAALTAALMTTGTFSFAVSAESFNNYTVDSENGYAADKSDEQAVLSNKVVSKEIGTLPDNDNVKICEVDLSDYIHQAGGLSNFENIQVVSKGYKSLTGTGSSDAALTRTQIDEIEKMIVTAVKNHDESILDISKYHIPNNSENVHQLLDLYIQAINTHPEFFHVSSYYQYAYRDGEIVGICCVYLEDKDTYAQMKSDFDKAAKVFTTEINKHPKWNDAEKALYIHDKITSESTYDPNYTSSYPDPENEYRHDYTAYGCLVDKNCVCQGFSLGYKYICQLVGVDVVFMSSEKLNHAWNAVNYDNAWYLVDTTWDLASVKYGADITDIYHNYFMKSESDFKHNSTDWLSDKTVDFSADFNGVCTSTKYDNFAWNGVNGIITYNPQDNYWYKDKGTVKLFAFRTVKNISDCTVTLREAAEFTGLSIKPEVKVKDGTATLKKGRDYTVAYDDNKQVGTARVIITGKGNYKGSITKTFKIIKESVEDCDISLSKANITFNNTAIKPEVTVKIGDEVINSRNYDVKYTNNVNAGKATVTITGKNNLKGKITKTFRISARSLDKCKVSLSGTSFKYTGSAIKPKVTVGVTGSDTPVSSSNYTVTYTNNVSKGTATVTITGKGSLKGTVTKTFKIV